MKIPSPLGHLHADEFLSEYWQKKPLLIKQALPGFSSPVSAEELAGLACESAVESRIILEKDGLHPWELRSGPFQESDFAHLPETHWTLLIQDIEKHLPELSWITELFHFIPDWRLDDLMISYAADQGSVGPHLDAYDVFLLQAEGKRHWKINSDTSRPMEKLQHTALDILSHFEAEQDWIVEPGDILYLPPGVAHYGVAIGECITCSIGFRAPSHLSMVQSFMDHLVDTIAPDILYQDPSLSRQKNPHELTEQSIAQLRKTLEQYLSASPALINHWAGTLLSEGKEDFQAENVSAALNITEFIDQWKKAGILYRNTALKFLYLHTDSELHFYIDGQHLQYTDKLLAQAEWLCASLQISWQQYDDLPDKDDLSLVFYDFYAKGFYYFL